MEVSFKPNAVVFDRVGFLNEVMVYARQALDRAEEKYIELIRKELGHDFDAPKHWTAGVKDSVRHLETSVAGAVITYTTGVSSAEGSAAWMRAMVLAFGMGSRGLTGEPLFAGPPGRLVWDGDLAGRRTSTSAPGPLPDSWNHDGYNYISNATKIMKTYFDDIVEEAMEALPRDIVARHIHAG